MASPGRQMFYTSHHDFLFDSLQTKCTESPAIVVEKPQNEAVNRKSGGRRDTRVSVSSQVRDLFTLTRGGEA